MSTATSSLRRNAQGQLINEWDEVIDENSNVVPLHGADDKRDPLTGAKKRVKSSSFAAAVADLEIDESTTRTHNLNPNMTLAELSRDIREMKAQISNNARASINIARERTGNEYRVEAGESITTGGRVYLHVIVTRIA